MTCIQRTGEWPSCASFVATSRGRCYAVLNGDHEAGDVLDDTRGTVHVGLQIGLISDGVEVRVTHGFFGGEPLL